MLAIALLQLTLQMQTPNPQPVVLELFTSEGCSSCPPADALMGEWIANNPTQSVRVLTFHVDYWNYLGWKDPFADAMFTKRQRNYVEKLSLNSAFTPQVVVDGVYSVVGSRKGEILNAMQKRQKERRQVDLHVTWDGPQQLRTRTPITSREMTLTYLTLIDESESRVLAGENRGRSLKHYRVVTGIESFPATADQHYPIPPSANESDRVVVLLEDTRTGAILASAEIALP